MNLFSLFTSPSAFTFTIIYLISDCVADIIFLISDLLDLQGHVFSGTLPRFLLRIILIQDVIWILA